MRLLKIQTNLLDFVYSKKVLKLIKGLGKRVRKNNMLPINKRKLIISIIIGISASAGDKNSIGQENRLAAAIVDNFSHATIGFLTWIGVLCAEPSFRFKNSFLEFIICAILSSLIDVDHFVEAKSLDLKVIFLSIFFFSLLFGLFYF